MKSIAWVDNVRFVASFAVVFLHVSSGIVTSAEVGSLNWWAGNISDSVVRWCVPVFVILTGYLLGDPNKEYGLVQFYRRRMHRLLIPIVAWSFFYSCLTYLTGGEKPVLYLLIEKVGAGVPYYHMWYFYMLIGLYVAAPFLNRLVHMLTDKELVSLTVISFCLSTLNMTADYFYFHSGSIFPVWFIAYIPYYFIGCLFHRNSLAIKFKSFSSLVFVSSCIVTVLGCYFLASTFGLYEGLFFYNYLSIPISLMAISIFSMLYNYKAAVLSGYISSQMAMLSLGIYLIHPFFLTFLTFIGFNGLFRNAFIEIPLLSMLVYILSAISVKVIMQVPYLKKIV